MDDPLLEVLTVTEAAALFNVHPRTVRRAIDSRRRPLRARKSPDTERGIWLIARASCEQRWGKQGKGIVLDKRKPGLQKQGKRR